MNLMQRSSARWIDKGRWLLFFLAAAAAGHQDISIQQAELSRLIAAAPGDAHLLLSRGELYRTHGQWDFALADYDRVSALDPGLDLIWLLRGLAHRDAGRLDEADGWLSRFLRAHPRHLAGLLGRAKLLELGGRRGEAAAEMSRAIEAANTPLPEMYLDRARLCEGPEEAVRGLNEGIARLGPIVSLVLPAIELDRRLGRFDSALARLDPLARTGGLERWLFLRGEIEEQAGRADRARAAYLEARRTLETLPEHRRQARTLEQLEAAITLALQRIHARKTTQ